MLIIKEMVKKEGFTLSVENAMFETLKMLQQGHTITEISKYRKVTRQAVYKKIASLISKGLVIKDDYGVYNLTQKGIEGLHSLVGLRYKLRQHNLGIKLKILQAPKNWNLKRQELRQLPYFNKVIKLMNNEQELFNFGKLWVKTTSLSVLLKLPTIYAKSWETALIQAFSILEDKIPQLEKMFNIRLVKDFKNSMTIISNEYASIQDALAKIYRSEGNRLYLTGEDGKIWLITDLSFSTDELEYIHPNKATDDIDAIAPFLNDLRKNPTTITELKDIISEQNKTIVGLIHNEVKHQKVLDSILTEFEEFKEWRKNNGYSRE